ncbi:hypothetical protein V1L54_29020 [Streptomyces sp. TRM 70361]|nr:hypothetical protein [Streptomyces sp. TRM 70361]MEE1943399.1 hypothetical protein [Streptomyces sp. TRM 70361]
MRLLRQDGPLARQQLVRDAADGQGGGFDVIDTERQDWARG